MSERRRVRHARLRQELPGRLEIRRSDSLRRILHSDRGSRQMLVSFFGRQQLLVSCPRGHDLMEKAIAYQTFRTSDVGLIPAKSKWFSPHGGGVLKAKMNPHKIYCVI